MGCRSRINAAANALWLLAISAAVAAPIVAAPPPAAGALAGMDRSVQPGVDFNQYANGSWLRSTEIPPDRSSTGVGRELTELTAARTAELIRQTAASTAPAGSDERKVADYYASFRDEAGIEAKGLTVLTPTLDRIAAISDRVRLAPSLGSTLGADVDVLNATKLYTDNVLGLWVAQDLDDSSRYAPFLLQGGLGMPDRDYYLLDSPHMGDVRSHYRAHIAAVLKPAGVADAERKAADIYALELRIAGTHSTRAESQDVKRGDNHWSRAQLQSNAPGLDWAAYLAAAGLEHQQDFIVWQPSAITGIAALAASEPLATWKAYLQFHAVEHSARFLTRAAVDEQFAFYGK